MKRFNRRQFLKTTALAAGSFAWTARSWAQVAGANSDVRVAVMGLNGRGKSHVASLAAIKGVRIVALCDPDSNVLARAKKLEGIASSVKTYTDMRELFDSHEIDAVTIATPNHWHALAGIWACQAGKDVYVEKPVSHNVWEGHQLVAAAQKYGRVMQAGTQIRSGEGMQEAVEWIGAGNRWTHPLFAAGFVTKRRDSIGKTNGPQPIPAWAWITICGPVPRRSCRRIVIQRSTSAPCITTGTGFGITATATLATRAFIKLAPRALVSRRIRLAAPQFQPRWPAGL